VFGLGDLSVSRNVVVGHLEDVINSSPHRLLNDFSAQWGRAGNNNPEAIFSVQHISDDVRRLGLPEWIHRELGSDDDRPPRRRL
jgi:hypothetical protein